MRVLATAVNWPQITASLTILIPVLAAGVVTVVKAIQTRVQDIVTLAVKEVMAELSTGNGKTIGAAVAATNTAVDHLPPGSPTIGEKVSEVSEGVQELVDRAPASKDRASVPKKKPRVRG